MDLFYFSHPLPLNARGGTLINKHSNHYICSSSRQGWKHSAPRKLIKMWHSKIYSSNERRLKRSGWESPQVWCHGSLRGNYRRAGSGCCPKWSSSSISSEEKVEHQITVSSNAGIVPDCYGGKGAEPGRQSFQLTGGSMLQPSPLVMGFG